MAIEFNCPHCQHQYKLKDELAGKTATCKTCRQKITIPQPATVPPDAPAKTAAEIEAEALAAMADEPAKVEQDAASQVVAVECQFCGHKWTEPLARAGKNTLCPNPECRQRVKIPEPKKEDILDWRQMRTKGPSLAKENQQKLEGVQDAAETKQVSGTALKEAGAIEEDIEPRPLKQKILFGVLIAGLLVGLVGGTWFFMSRRTANQENRLMQEAQEEFAKPATAEPLTKEEVPVLAALLHISAGEYALRFNDPKKLKEATEQYGKALVALRAPPSPSRNAVCAELAVATLDLGGTNEQISERTRLWWTPEATLKHQPNERVFTVFETLREVLALVQGADAEFRTQLARRLARELVKRGQTAMALDLLPPALFTPTERDDARALVALEVYRTDKASDLPKKVAGEMVPKGAALVAGAPPTHVQMLFLALKTEKAPDLKIPAPVGATISDPARYTYTGVYLLEDRTADALKLAQGGKPEIQLKCLTLCADWAADPNEALNAALGVVAANAGVKGVTLSPSSIMRLSQIAAAKNLTDLANKFAGALTDDGAKAWARGDALRARLAAAPKEKGDVAWSELPADPKKFRAGHAWERLWLARHNTAISGNRDAEAKAASEWPMPMSLFGKAGVALGLQDQGK